ncbi:uncharacterized protein LOC134532918 [Bacillus rossius redtenbacheri]|uniref:uncharacterized protein LOC134532918 n=1 Tax=Bacillus rossius redtenbacheri TaxID=93214 RepID=UPI002FDE23B1
MDVEQLIVEVFARKPLWQVKNCQHHNRGVIDKLWGEVASALESDTEELRKKWKNLKDRFRKELRKIRDKKSGADGATQQESDWPFFPLLHFLRDQMTPAQMSGNLQEMTASEIHDTAGNSDDEGGQETQVRFASERTVDRPQTPPNTLVRTPDTHELVRKRKRDNSQDVATQKLLQIEEKKLEFLRKENEQEKNDDYHFCMSIIPHMNNFTSRQKLRVRNRIQSVIIEELDKIEGTQTNQDGLTGYVYGEDGHYTQLPIHNNQSYLPGPSHI